MQHWKQPHLFVPPEDAIAQAYVELPFYDVIIVVISAVGRHPPQICPNLYLFSTTFRVWVMHNQSIGNYYIRDRGELMLTN